jgi:hypothetical protein
MPSTVKAVPAIRRIGHRVALVIDPSDEQQHRIADLVRHVRDQFDLA